jgi:hypothetical protein
MKRVVKFQMLAAILGIAMMSCTSCKKDGGGDDPGDGPGGNGVSTTAPFKIKQATIVYDVLGGEYQWTVRFDDNGKKFRLDEDYDFGNIYILDEDAKKAYKLDKSSKKYEEIALSAGQAKRKDFVMTDYTAAGYTKTTETVAGKSCTVYTATSGSTTAAYGGWEGIQLLIKLNSADVRRAVSLSETVTANSFTIPSDYTKK